MEREIEKEKTGESRGEEREGDGRKEGMGIDN